MFSSLRNIPIHSRLFRDLVLVILLTVALLILANWFLIGTLKREIAAGRIADASQLVRDEVKNLLFPVEQQLRIARDALIANRVSPTDRAKLNRQFLPILRHMDQIVGAAYADETGQEYFLLREPQKGYRVRERQAGSQGKMTWLALSEGEEQPLREGISDYDPRHRLWYQGALQTSGGAVVWTEPYIFHSLQVPGITASLAWRAQEQTRVLAFDITLQRILEAIDRLPLGEAGRAFLFSADGGLFAPKKGEEAAPSTDRERFFSAQETFGGPLLIDAIAAWQKAGKPAGNLLSFVSEGQTWWGGFRPLSERAESAWIGVVIPQSETLGILAHRWHLLALNAVVILAFGIGLVAILMRKYGRQLRDLPKLSIDRQDYAKDLYDLIGSGESTHLEFKSTMRMNLHTQKPGKEIELAWLKGVAAFMNTEGGILLLGVSDDGTLLGLEADRFENEDRCRLHFKNLVHQHLGAEKSQYLHFELYELEGKQIGAVECERAPEPVFLRHKNEEYFLIRSGPSNIDLSLSRALSYIQRRF